MQRRLLRKRKKLQKNVILSIKNIFKIENSNENPLSFFRWLPLRKKYQLKQFEQNALAHGIHVYHSHRFLVKKDESDQFIRISLTSAKDSNELEKGLCALKNFLLNIE